MTKHVPFLKVFSVSESLLLTLTLYLCLCFSYCTRSTGVEAPGRLVSPVQPSPAGACSPGLRPPYTPGPLHPLIHLVDLSGFVLPFLFMPLFSPLCTMPYFWNRMSISQDSQCAILFYVLRQFTVLSSSAVPLCCCSNILPYYSR